LSDTIARLNEALEGRYHVLRELGAGGMATVFLADDLRHERKVAIKVLKPELAAVVGGDRFLAEIKTTANLQHPHILPLFDSGQAGTFLFYVMPYIEGETLRDKLDREKQLPVDEALGIATAVANALHTAHEAGVVHRDIKPGNILLSRGEPLVADFGIALAVGSAGGSRLTETGLSVGTPYYMSPEQATGDQVVGAPSDTFALACVLYEMLVGEPPYPGTTAQAVLGKIIQGAPVSATAVRKSIPLNVDAAIRKALEKIPADRFSTARGFAAALADPGFRHGALPAGVAGGEEPGRWKKIALGTSTLSLLLLAALTIAALAPGEPLEVERFKLRTVEGQSPNYEFAVANDGSAMVFQIVRDGVPRLMVRRLENLEPTEIPGTEDGYGPVFSPDDSEVGFITGSSLKVAPIGGGVVRTLADSVFCCSRWGEDGFIYYSNVNRTISRVPANGGPIEQMTTNLGDTDGQHGDFQILPGGDAAVFTVWADPVRIDAIDFATGERRAVTAGLKPYLMANGTLVFSSLEGQILAARFDAGSRTLAGAAIPLVEGVRVDGDDWPFYGVSPEGTLLYWTGASTSGNDARVVRVTRSGRVTPVDPTWYFNPDPPEASLRLSPDGRRIALKIKTDDGDDIWVKQLDDGPLSRLTLDPERDWRPWWSADGRWIYFHSWRNGEMDLYRKRADGTGSPELLLDLEGHVAEAALTADGQSYILRWGGSTQSGVGGLRDILGLNVGDAEPYALAAEPYDEKGFALSPDGRWLAYESTETGRDEIYVRPYPNVADGKWQISTQGGINPVWARNGREIFFVSQSREMTVAALELTSEVEVVSRDELFNVNQLGLDARANYAGWDVDLDDQSLIMIQFGGGSGDRPNEFVLVQNWLEEVSGRLPR
jgi:serine/threonine-protein kinase